MYVCMYVELYEYFQSESLTSRRRQRNWDSSAGIHGRDKGGSP